MVIILDDSKTVNCHLKYAFHPQSPTPTQCLHCLALLHTCFILLSFTPGDIVLRKKCLKYVTINIFNIVVNKQKYCQHFMFKLALTKAGVPQVSVLGPLSLTTQVNSLCQSIICIHQHLYIGDTASKEPGFMLIVLRKNMPSVSNNQYPVHHCQLYQLSAWLYSSIF